MSRDHGNERGVGRVPRSKEDKKVKEEEEVECGLPAFVALLSQASCLPPLQAPP